MKTRTLSVIVAFVCLMAFLNVSIFAQTAQAEPEPGLKMVQFLRAALKAEGYKAKRDGDDLIIEDQVVLKDAFTVQDLEDWEGIEFRLVEPEEPENSADVSAEDILQLKQCLDAADFLFGVSNGLCQIGPADFETFICRTRALFNRILASLECIATYVPQEPPSGPVVSVFVTGRRYRGNLRGLAGADRKCQRRAEAAGLSGTWTAWVSDSTENAIDRIPDGQYQLLNGTQVADDKAGLTGGLLNAAINLNEFGETQPGFVWTGTAPDGTGTLNTCNNWTDNSSGYSGDRGVTSEINDGWTNLEGATTVCSDRNRLYCFGVVE